MTRYQPRVAFATVETYLDAVHGDRIRPGQHVRIDTRDARYAGKGRHHVGTLWGVKSGPAATAYMRDLSYQARNCR